MGISALIRARAAANHSQPYFTPSRGSQLPQPQCSDNGALLMLDRANRRSFQAATTRCSHSEGGASDVDSCRTGLVAFIGAICTNPAFGASSPGADAAAGGAGCIG